MKILVTGATRGVRLLNNYLDVIATVRSDNLVLPAGVQQFVAGYLSPTQYQ